MEHLFLTSLFCLHSGFSITVRIDTWVKAIAVKAHTQREGGFMELSQIPFIGCCLVVSQIGNFMPHSGEQRWTVRQMV